jgi:hypothetical protein
MPVIILFGLVGVRAAWARRRPCPIHRWPVRASRRGECRGLHSQRAGNTVERSARAERRRLDAPEKSARRRLEYYLLARRMLLARSPLALPCRAGRLSNTTIRLHWAE